MEEGTTPRAVAPRSGIRGGRVVAASGGRPTRRLKQPYSNVQTLKVECWCRARVVRVPVSEVRACRTGSCGAMRCTEALFRPAQ